LNSYYCMLFGSRITVRVSSGFSIWLVSGYAHVFVLLSVVIVTLPSETVATWPTHDGLSAIGHVDPSVTDGLRHGRNFETLRFKTVEFQNSIITYSLTHHLYG